MTKEARGVGSADGAASRRGRYQKGEVRRREILLAAIDVFSRRGYRDTSLREIAESVGLTQAGLIHYFPSKAELFVEVLRVRDEINDLKGGSDIIDLFRTVVADNTKVEGLVHLFVTVSADATDSAHPGHSFFRTRYERLARMLRERIAAGQEDGTVTRAISPDMAARLLIAAVDGMQTQWLLDPEHTDMVAAFEAFWETLLATNPDSSSAPAPFAKIA
jgi:AcrR family transcriptional regulator